MHSQTSYKYLKIIIKVGGLYYNKHITIVMTIIRVMEHRSRVTIYAPRGVIYTLEVSFILLEVPYLKMLTSTTLITVVTMPHLLK